MVGASWSVARSGQGVFLDVEQQPVLSRPLSHALRHVGVPVTTPATETAASYTPRLAEPLPHQLLSALGQHRMATTSQLHDLLRPKATRQTVSAPLNTLLHKGLVGYTMLPQSNRSRVWYLTGEGARLARGFGALRGRPPYPISSATAASLKTPHALTVVRTRLPFAADARRLGHEHGRWDWTPAVSHSIGEGEGVVTDAVMHYTLVAGAPRLKLRAFGEVDRTTVSSGRLASKASSTPACSSTSPLPSDTANPHRRWRPGVAALVPRLPACAVRPHPCQPPHAGEPDGRPGSMADIHPRGRRTRPPCPPLGAAVQEDLEQHGPASALWTPLTGDTEQRAWNEL
ncbi:replication-relaxation family protein [Streptomyces sp. NPDC051214]|uniref:replication-relaxation family protein n=1 Tax=Streptomyces sp. NPDC051214 TaxID=3155282 RepID=UPI0034299753